MIKIVIPIWATITKLILFLVKIFFIDKDDAARTQKFRWFINTQGYPAVRQQGKVILLHRYILNMPEKFTYDAVVDHIDRNPLNNRKSNLRIVTQAVNTRNRAMSRNNTSGVPGVFWSDEMKAWRAYRTVDGVSYKIGNFENIDEAASAMSEFEDCIKNGRQYVDRSTHDNRLKSATGYKNIYKNKPHGYCAVVNSKYLGLFDNLEEAKLIRDNYLKQ